jgi:hypothetical protein
MIILYDSAKRTLQFSKSVGQYPKKDPKTIKLWGMASNWIELLLQHADVLAI